jgi:hypothetical protein
MPTFPVEAHRFGDLVVSVGTEAGPGDYCVQIRVTWDRGGSALFAVALNSEVETFRLLVPTARVSAASSTRSSLRALPVEERRSGVEPFFRQVALTGLPPEYAFARRVRPRLENEPQEEAPPYQRLAARVAAQDQ